MNKKTFKKISVLFLSTFLLSTCSLAIEDDKNLNKQTETTKKERFHIFKINKNEKQEEIKLDKEKKSKKIKIKEIELPKVTSFKNRGTNFSVMTIEDCINYAVTHNPNLFASKNRIDAAKSGINIQKGSFAPRLTARVNYNHNASKATGISTTNTDSIGFSAGISQLIWDFGKTIAKINMAKYDYESVLYDYDFDILNKHMMSKSTITRF